MQDQELTGWFELSEQSPWEPGVYEVICEVSDRTPDYSMWNGEFFEMISRSPNHAASRAKAKSGLAIYKWRGLSSDPNAKPKPKCSGNPKVTRYVVIAVGSEKTVATFKGKTAALDYEEMVNFQVRVKKIRFRSPE